MRASTSKWLSTVMMAAAVLGACGSSTKASTSPPVASPTSSSVANTPSTTHPSVSTTVPESVGVTTAPAPTSPSTTVAPTTAPPTTGTPEGLAASTTAPSPSTTVAPTTTGPAAPVQVIADCSSPSYEPTTIILACGDGGVSATAISWSSWGSTSATGTSVIKANLCNPDCAQGSTGSFPASIMLSGVTQGAAGAVFSTLTASFTGASPNGSPTETYSLAGLG